MSAPAEWEHDTSSGDSYWIGAGVDRYVVMTRRGPAAVDEWVTTLTTQERIVVTEPEPTEVGGAEGYVLDATASEAATEGAVGICMHPGRCWTLFEDVAGYWSIDEGRQNRIWVVDVSGDTILIVTEAPQASFEEWASVVEDALATLDWGE